MTKACAWILLCGLYTFGCASGPQGSEWEDAGNLAPWGSYDAEVEGAQDVNDPGEPDFGKAEYVVPNQPGCIVLHENDPAQAYFSKSCAAQPACPCSPVDLGVVIAHHIMNADSTVDVCVMELQHFDISDALIAVHQAGVAVRIVMDDWYADPEFEKAVADVLDAGIEIVTDAPSDKLMHSKFVVIDSRTVLVSSANFSTFDGQSNANSLLVFHSQQLASIFTQRFESMYVSGVFHKSAASGPYQAMVAGWPVEVLFGPDWKLMDRVVQAIEGAQQSIHFSIFAFTLGEVKDAFLSRCGDVELLGVFDEDQGKSQDSVASGGWCPQAQVLASQVQADFGYKKLHHKVLVVDPETTGNGLAISGSTNWSYSAAAKNDEVMIVVRQPELVHAYESEFQARFQEAQ